MNYTDRIFPTNKGLTTYIEELINKNYQIPTFQRDVVWEKYKQLPEIYASWLKNI